MIMKNFKNVLAILFVSVILCGCSNSVGKDATNVESNGGKSVVDEDAAKFVGTWKSVENAADGTVTTSEWTFNQDGMGSMTALIKKSTSIDGAILKSNWDLSGTFNWCKEGSKLIVRTINYNKEIDESDFDIICSDPIRKANLRNLCSQSVQSINESMKNATIDNNWEILEQEEKRLKVKSADGSIKVFDKVQ